MTNKTRLWLPITFAVIALGASACGESSDSGSSDNGSSNNGSSSSDSSEMSGMNDSEMSAMEETSTSTSEMSEMSGMSDMGGMQGMDMGSMLMDENGEYSDELFIDEMIPHHQAAIEEARVALQNTDRPELIELSNDIVTSQEREIQELIRIKEEEFGSSDIPDGMSDEEMEMMGMSMTPEELAEARPFDRAFLDNMTPHHESAIEMSEVALDNSENEDIRRIAEEIISAQEREIQQMQQWRQEWYPNG